MEKTTLRYYFPTLGAAQAFESIAFHLDFGTEIELLPAIGCPGYTVSFYGLVKDHDKYEKAVDMVNDFAEKQGFTI